MRIGGSPAILTGTACVAIVLAVGAGTAVLAAGDDASTQGRRVLAAGTEPVVTGPDALDTVDSCRELLDWYVAQGVDRVGPWGWDSPMVAMRGPLDVDGDRLSTMPVPAAESAAGEFAATAPSPMESAESSETGTNVQEEGVDEPDVVKTDGSLLVRVRRGALVTYDVSGSSGGDPVELGSLDLAGIRDPELLLVGDRVVVTGHDLGTRFDHPRTIAVTIDVSDPAQPVVVDRDTITADLVAARQHGETVRLVVTTGLPPLRFVDPGAFRSQGAALRANEAVVRETTLDDWLPQVTDEDGTTERLVDCEDVRLPDDKRAGFGTLAVVGFDPTSPEVREAEGVATESRLAYLSVDRLYVAETSWFGGFPGWVIEPTVTRPRWWVPDLLEDWTMPEMDEEPLQPRVWPVDDGVTRLHSFALDGLGTTYVASGKVDGNVADRWAMDEADGVLRLAVGPTHSTGNFNSVVTLAERGDELVEIGRVDRLGVGEEIKSVRWFDDLAIVVTFRQTDPLYAIDLSNPSRPKLLGELKIPGFSEYLHPLDSRWMLGLGQHATQRGVTRGAQAALFDLADLANPERVAVVGYEEGSWATAAWDPRQFTWLPDQRTALTVVSDLSRRRAGWISVLEVGDGTLSNRMVKVADGARTEADLPQVRLVPLPSGDVLLVTADDVSRFPL